MLWQFDHHFSQWDYFQNTCVETCAELKVVTEIQAEYVVEQRDIEARLEKQRWTANWLFGFRNITNTTNERTVVASIFPRVAPVYSIRTVFWKSSQLEAIHLISMFNLINSQTGLMNAVKRSPTRFLGSKRALNTGACGFYRLFSIFARSCRTKGVSVFRQDKASPLARAGLFEAT